MSSFEFSMSFLSAAAVRQNPSSEHEHPNCARRNNY